MVAHIINASDEHQTVINTKDKHHQSSEQKELPLKLTPQVQICYAMDQSGSKLTLSADLPWLVAGLMVTITCLLLDRQSPTRITSQSVCGMAISFLSKV